MTILANMTTPQKAEFQAAMELAGLDALLANRNVLYYKLVNADYYVDPAHASASDLNDGRSEAFPFATLAAAVAAVGAGTNKTIAVKRGSVMRGSPAVVTAPNLTITEYGSTSDAPWAYLGSTAVAAASLTSIGGGVYSFPRAYDPRTLALVSPTGVITKLYQAAISIGQTAVTSGTTSADPSVAGEWLWNGTDTCKFKLPASISDITGYTVEVPVNHAASTGTAITDNAGGLHVVGGRLSFWNNAGIAFENPNGKETDCIASYNAGDGFDVGYLGDGFVFTRGQALHNGPRYGGPPGPGDGVSVHDNAGTNIGPSGTITGMRFIGNTLTGSGNQSGCRVAHYVCYFEDNGKDIYVYNSSTALGYHYFDYCLHAHFMKPTVWFECNGAGGGPLHVVRIRNPTIYYASGLTIPQPYSASFQGYAFQIDNLLFRSDTTFSNFAQFTESGTMTVRNAIVSGASARWRPGFGTTVTETGALSTDPLLVAPSVGNFALRSTSPATAAGVNVGLTADYYGTPVPATPDRGAVQRR